MSLDYVLSCKKWRNIQYDFTGDSNANNCSLNVFVGGQEEVIKLDTFIKLIINFQINSVKIQTEFKSILELESCHYFNVFVPLISQATKCKIFISNFHYNKSIVANETDFLSKVANNVSD